MLRLHCHTLVLSLEHTELVLQLDLPRLPQNSTQICMCADNSPILPKVVSGGKASVALPLAGRPKIFVAAANVCACACAQLKNHWLHVYTRFSMARFYKSSDYLACLCLSVCLWVCVCVCVCVQCT